MRTSRGMAHRTSQQIPAQTSRFTKRRGINIMELFRRLDADGTLKPEDLSFEWLMMLSAPNFTSGDWTLAAEVLRRQGAEPISEPIINTYLA